MPEDNTEEVPGVTPFNPHDSEFAVAEELNTTKLNPEMVEPDTQPLSPFPNEDQPTRPLNPQDLPQEKTA